MANERFESVWDAICDAPEEAERMKECSRQKIEGKLRSHCPNEAKVFWYPGIERDLDVKL